MRRAGSLSLLLVTAACGAEPTPTLPAPPSPRPVALSEEAGFADIDAFTVDLGAVTGVEGPITTPPARLFYVFQPADEAPEDKPIFVLFNGGPAYATTIGLFANNLARRSLDGGHNGGVTVGPSPRPWTALGNLLFLDARQAGFSYDRVEPSAGAEARAATFQAGVYNPYVDAADCARALFSFLGAHPEIEGRPVVLVGESYGGTRAAVMLWEILHPEALEDPASDYHDPGLAAVVRAHFAATRPGLDFSPELAAAQFGRQVLLEPALAGKEQWDAANARLGQVGSTLDEIAAEHGIACDLCAPSDAGCDPAGAASVCANTLMKAGYDLYDLSRTSAEIAAGRAAAEGALRQRGDLQTMLGVDPAAIRGLPAAEREGAFRFGGGKPFSSLAGLDPDAPEPLAGDLGALAAWDHYFVGFGSSPQAAANGHPLDWLHGARWGPIFTANLPFVRTFVTRARYDIVVSSPALGDALIAAGAAVSASLDTAPRPGVARPGWMTIVTAGGGAQVIRMPGYEASGHSVSMGQPEELFEDVAAWLVEP